MSEDETIADFHMRIRDMANTSFSLGEKMSNEKLVRKILRSLPKKFAMKVTAIEEAHDIGTLQVDELIGSFKSYEMNVADKSDKKNKSIAFISNTTEEDEQYEMDFAGEFTDALALL